MLVDFEIKLRKIFKSDFWYVTVRSPLGMLSIFGILVILFLLLVF